jgi:hypothetical protein
VRVPLRPGVAAAWFLVAGALLAGCSTTVDGAAICPGCGIDSEPEFPAPRPSTPAPETPTAAPAEPPSGATQVLAPNANGYVFIETRSGRTRCQISADAVGCESDFADPPRIDGQPANGVEVSADGSNRWVVGNLGAMPTVTIGYATYYAAGWTVDAGADGTRFTNDGTGRGMFVSTEVVDFF